MDFLLYLTPIGKEILYNVIMAKFSIHENIELCHHDSVYGSVSYPPKKFTICTNNIKQSSMNPSWNINRTVVHEAVHVVQLCKNNNIIRIQNPPLLDNQKYSRLKMSLDLASNNSYDKEYEAYLLEDSPQEVLYYLKKFCF
jgi:hypothetical protein